MMAFLLAGSAVLAFHIMQGSSADHKTSIQKCNYLFFWVVLGLSTAIASGTACGNELSPEDSKLLGKSLGRSWYDPQGIDFEDIGRFSNGKEIDVSDRERSLVRRDTNFSSNTTSSQKSWNWGDTDFGKWMQTFGLFLAYLLSTPITYLVLALLIVLLFFLAQYLGWINFNGFFAGSPKKADTIAQRARDKIRVTDLPFELAPSNLSLLEQSDRYLAQNDYAKAMIYYYSHLLVELDDAGLLRLERGKTNRAYLKEVMQFPRLKKYLNTAILDFEKVFFGRHDLSKEDFESLRNELTSFETWVHDAKLGLEQGSMVHGVPV